MPAPSQPQQYILLPVNPWFIGFTLVLSLMLNLLPLPRGLASWAVFGDEDTVTGHGSGGVTLRGFLVSAAGGWLIGAVMALDAMPLAARIASYLACSVASLSKSASGSAYAA